MTRPQSATVASWCPSRSRTLAEHAPRQWALRYSATNGAESFGLATASFASKRNSAWITAGGTGLMCPSQHSGCRFSRTLQTEGVSTSQQALLDAIQRALASLPHVQAALLFGSYATGRARADSDIDVAILLDETPPASEKKNALMSLVRALGQELRADRLDVVLLNDAPPKLAFHILRHGVVAFEKGRVPLHRFRVATYSRHADYEPVERLFRAATKQRALNEAERG